MPVQPDIALGFQGPNLNTIGSFLDIGRKRLELDKARDTYNSDVAQRQAESSSAQSGAQVNAANVQPLIQQQAAQTGTAQARYSVSQLNAMRAHLSNGYQQLQSIVSKPNVTLNDIEKGLKQTLHDSDAPLSAYAQAAQSLPPPNLTSDEYKQFAAQKLLAVQSGMEQLNAIYPSPTMVNKGDAAQPTAGGNEVLTGVPAGTPQGAPVKMGLPPTTPVMRNGVPGYLGDPGAQNPQQPAQSSIGNMQSAFEQINRLPPGPARDEALAALNNPARPGQQPQQQGFIQSGPAIGQVEGTNGPIQVANKHFEGVVADASAAPTRIAALQTIMQEAPKAMTGGGSLGDIKRNLLKAWSNVYGVDSSEQTSTDVMAKNLALIAGQAGNTDAARALGEMGNPNFHMTQAAIDQTGAQLLGIEKKKISAQQVFSGIKTNDPRYSQLMTQWQKFSDPRLFEYAALPPEQKKEWLGRLSPGVRADLAMKASALDKMGVEP